MNKIWQNCEGLYFRAFIIEELDLNYVRTELKFDFLPDNF